MVIGRSFLVKINANIGNSAVTSGVEEDGPATRLDPCRGTIGPLAGTNAAQATETPHRDLPTTVIDRRKALGVRVTLPLPNAHVVLVQGQERVKAKGRRKGLAREDEGERCSNGKGLIRERVADPPVGTNSKRRGVKVS
jgi:hypothetical protein